MRRKTLPVPIALAVLLGSLLSAGWGNICFLEKGADSLLEITERLEVSLSEENWSEAENLFKETEKKWAKLRMVWPMLIHHQEMDRIEESLVKLKSHLLFREGGDSMAELYSLIKYIRHIPEKERLNLQNIF
jgi:hypothetical protein